MDVRAARWEARRESHRPCGSNGGSSRAGARSVLPEPNVSAWREGVCGDDVIRPQGSWVAAGTDRAIVHAAMAFSFEAVTYGAKRRK